MLDNNPPIGDYALDIFDPQDFIASADGKSGVAVTIPPLNYRSYPEHHQYEFADKYTRGLCTIYAFMQSLETLIGRKLSIDERETLAKLRYEAPDFDQVNGGGYTKVAYMVGVKWWNALHPERKIKLIVIPKNDPLVLRALSGGHRLGWGYRGNAKFGEDRDDDGEMDGGDWGTPTTYGHVLGLVSIRGQTSAIDNYEGRATNIFGVKDWATFRKYANVHANLFLLLYEDQLTPSQNKRFEAKKKGIWNGERENESATRHECAKMIMNTKLVQAETFWTKDNPWSKCERKDAVRMVERSIHDPVGFSWQEMTVSITRGEMAEIVMLAINAKTA